MEFIDVQKQYKAMKEEIDEAMAKVLGDGRFIMGEEVKELESQLQDYVGVKHCITCGNGTDGLQMALMTLGIQPGDEIITTPFSFISTADVVSLLGAKPIFVDIDPETYNFDISKIEEKITKKTKAIIAVGIFGQMADCEGLKKISKKYNLKIIEDAAQSFGASFKGTKSCQPFSFGSTSFFPAKPLSCYGDGGAVFTNDDNFAQQLRAIRVHGGARHDYKRQGINSRLDTIQAAILKVKLKHYDKEIVNRKRAADFYNHNLQGLVTTPKVQAGNEHVYAQYTIRVPAEMRDSIIKEMAGKGVPTGAYYPRIIPEQGMYQELAYQKGSLPHAEKAASEVLSLPMHPYLTEEDQSRVVKGLKEVLSLECV
ncbi:UDP-2-acetamido-2-deoxy-3-oxo-D-glucuronate aminotransferase [Chlamydiales bacterium SCGC AB-751-O23]|jgi:UDP-2-acetamido-2-deoxy-ribo-hexuluronate aminotransferase|nr:UDP-2-acetamido-2-deoxy-3-oxo-D-glucuronate aminotransferase [Chlamydiales bacterium SCGC AB-751-O23]